MSSVNGELLQLLLPVVMLSVEFARDRGIRATMAKSSFKESMKSIRGHTKRGSIVLENHTSVIDNNTSKSESLQSYTKRGRMDTTMNRS